MTVRNPACRQDQSACCVAVEGFDESLRVTLFQGQRHHCRCVSPGSFVVTEFQVVLLSPSLQTALAVRIDRYDVGVIDRALLFR